MAANQEVLDAINATIATNGVKGISAESLRNVLTLMVENMGSDGGSGDGALRVYALQNDSLDFSNGVDGFLEEMKDYLSQDSLELITDIFNKAMQHNINVYNTITQARNDGKSPLIMLDYGFIDLAGGLAMVDILAPNIKTDGLSIVLNDTEPAMCICEQISNPDIPEDELNNLKETIGLTEMFKIVPVSGAEWYCSNVHEYPISYKLEPNGSVICEELVYIYYPEEGYELTESEKENNLKIKGILESDWQDANLFYRHMKFKGCMGENGGYSGFKHTMLWFSNDGITYLDGTDYSLNNCIINEDGTVTMTKVGKLSITTEE
jgi:hypothetical protein